MNTLESYSILSPNNKTEECAKFVIDDTTNPYILSNIMTEGRAYTLSFWIQSDSDRNILVADTTFSSYTEWSYYTIKFTADSTNLSFYFLSAGVYYIYHPQLEIGNITTDYVPAPEDMATVEDLSATNDRVQEVYEYASELAIETHEIRASVSAAETVIDDLSGELASTMSELASMKLDSDELKVEFKNFTDNGATKVTTETGFTFDKEGMTVDSSDSATKTQVTPDGMTVYKKDANGTQEEVLEATSYGVDATNLHAKTYLIIGGRSRFENYGTDRTGCFWIGG